MPTYLCACVSRRKLSRPRRRRSGARTRRLLLPRRPTRRRGPRDPGSPGAPPAGPAGRRPRRVAEPEIWPGGEKRIIIRQKSFLAWNCNVDLPGAAGDCLAPLPARPRLPLLPLRLRRGPPVPSSQKSPRTRRTKPGAWRGTSPAIIYCILFYFYWANDKYI